MTESLARQTMFVTGTTFGAGKAAVGSSVTVGRNALATGLSLERPGT